jgi:multidrug resistance efflux pump
MRLDVSDSLAPLADITIPGERIVENATGIIVGIAAAIIVAGVFVAGTTRINRIVDATGELEPQAVWVARAAEDGKIASMTVRTGDIVAANQVLFTIDSSSYVGEASELSAQLRADEIERTRHLSVRPVDIETAEAQERLAQVNVQKAKSHLLEALVENGQSANVDSALRTPMRGDQVSLDLAHADVLSAEHQFQIAHLALVRLLSDSLDDPKDDLQIAHTGEQLALARAKLRQLIVHAERGGIVLSERLDELVGKAVHVGDQVLEVGAVDGWRAQLLVAEVDVHRIRIGQPVRLEFDATETQRPDPVDGEVVGVAVEPWHPDLAPTDPSPAVGGQAPQYRVLVSVTPNGANKVFGLFRRGFTVRAHIRVERVRASTLVLEKLFGIFGASL